jgi:8-oxo-dGTP diphosphatase
MTSRQEWVVGFLFDESSERVVLVRKNRPAWQAGLLNGVGGKVEAVESPEAAMRREFAEEAGVDIGGWEHFVSLEWEEGTVHFYRRRGPMWLLEMCETQTDEEVEQHLIHELAVPAARGQVTPNLLWLVPLAAHRYDTYDVIDVVETGTTLRKPGRLVVDEVA